MAAATSNTVRVKLDGEASGLVRAAGQARKALTGLDGSTKRSAKGFASFSVGMGNLRAGFGGVVKGAGLAGVAVAGVGVGLFQMGKAVIGSAVSLEQMDRKARVVFGSSFPQMEKWAGQVAARMGLTRRELLGVASGFSDMLIPMGFTRDRAAQMSQQFGSLSGVLAEWSNGQLDAAAAGQVLQSALTGEYDSLQSLGIPINQAAVDTEVLRLKQSGLKLATEDMYKAQAALNIVMKGTGDAQRSYAAGTESLGAKVNIAKARLKELQQSLIVKITPWITTAFTWFNNNWPNILLGFVSVARGVLSMLGPLATVGKMLLYMGAGALYAAGAIALASGNVGTANKLFGQAKGVQDFAGRLDDMARTAQEKATPALDKLEGELKSQSLAQSASANQAQQNARALASAGTSANAAAPKVKGLTTALNGVPKNTTFRVQGDTSQAAGAIGDIQRRLSVLQNSRTVHVVTIIGDNRVNFNGGAGRPGGSTAMATGGIVPNLPGSSPYRDSVHAYLKPGEMVLNDVQQRRMFNLLAGNANVATASKPTPVQVTVKAADDAPDWVKSMMGYVEAYVDNARWEDAKGIRRGVGRH